MIAQNSYCEKKQSYHLGSILAIVNLFGLCLIAQMAMVIFSFISQSLHRIMYNNYHSFFLTMKVHDVYFIFQYLTLLH